MENRRRGGGGAEYGATGGRGARTQEEPSRPSPRTRRPREQDAPRPGSGAKAHDDAFEDAPWIKAQKEAARKKAEQARWVNSGSNGTRIYNLYAEPPMDWDDCEGAKKFRSIAKWILNTEDLPPVSAEALEGYKGLPIKGDFELEGTNFDFLILTDSKGNKIDNTPHPSNGTPRNTNLRPQKNASTPGILDIGSLSLNSKPRDGVKYVQRGGASGAQGGSRRAPLRGDYGDADHAYPRGGGRGGPRGTRP